MRLERPNTTAAVIAATLLLLRDSRELGHLVDRGSLDAVERAVRLALPGAGTVLDHVPLPIVRRLAFALERAVSPGFMTHYAVRKALIRERLARAIDDGFQQVVLLGAGFDMLSASVAPSARVFELDLPATQAAKVRALEGTRARPVTYVAGDLARERLDDLLARAPGFRGDEDTVFVAEGLLMYLEEEAVDRLLGDMSRGRRRTQAILSFVTPDEGGRPRMHSQRKIVDLCMRLLGEEFVWGEASTQLEQRLERCSLRVVELVSNQELVDALARDQQVRPRPTSGEVVVVATHTATRRESGDVAGQSSPQKRSRIPSQ